MSVTRRESFTALALLLGQPARAASPDRAPFHDPDLHLLNRITWGPRPEEVARVAEIGREAYLDEQLNPESLDDPVADERLKHLPILEMDRRTIASLTDSEGRSYRALVQGLLVRAIYSRRQLLERVVEFWADHFNISASDDYVPDLVVFQREAIRKHALGNFRDLLIATAKSPAMLYRLDNYVNVAEHPNENYARELLELHTLGVNGGYTEADVKEVARAFTGWTVHNKTRTGFWFNAAEHDDGEKQVLGHVLPARRGIEDGLHVLSLVAHHPATARYICRKLAVRFVADDPPPSLVESLTRVWIENRGAIKPVLRHLFLSDEFSQAVGQKLRRPLDLLVGILRATGTEIHNWWLLEEALTQLGQPPYGWDPPDGYPDTAEAWLSTGGLLARWNAAMFFTHSAYSDPDEGRALHTRLRARIGEPATAGALVDAVASQVFGRPLPHNNDARASFIAYAADEAGADTPVTAHLLARKLGSLFGLMLASPLYQWR